MKISASELAGTIDHTLLKPEATPDQIDRLCDEALRYGFYAVCVHPVFVDQAVKRLEIKRSIAELRVTLASELKASLDRGAELESKFKPELRSESGSKLRAKLRSRVEAVERDASSSRQPVVVSVSGFPHGAEKTETKTDQARRAMDDGATEIDMVAQLGALMADDRKTVSKDIESVAHAVHRCPGGLLKVILETAALTDDQIILGCRCCAEAQADFVKTSTGFHPGGGATMEHVRLLHRYASPMRVKASGGIGTTRQALRMIEAGAARIGTSSGVAIIQSLRSIPCCGAGEEAIQ